MAMNGRFWRLYTKDPADKWVPFAGAREESMTHNNQAIDRTGKESDGYRHLLENGGRSVDLSLSCVAVLGPAYDRLMTAVTANAFMPLRAESFNAVLEGDFHVSNYRESGADSQAVNFSASFQSADRYKHLIGVTVVAGGELITGTLTRASTLDYYDRDGDLQTAPADTPATEYNPVDMTLRGLAMGADDQIAVPLDDVIEQGALLYTEEPATTADRTVYALSDGTAENRIALLVEGGGYVFRVTVGGTDVADLDTGVECEGYKRKEINASYAVDAFYAAASGGDTVSDTSGNVPNLTQWVIGDPGNHDRQCWIMDYSYRPRAIAQLSPGAAIDVAFESSGDPIIDIFRRTYAQGAYYDPSDASTVFIERENPTTIAGIGDPVGAMLDKSPNANHVTAPSDAARPTLQRTPGGLYYLDFDGVDDALAVNLNNSGALTLAAAAERTGPGTGSSGRQAIISEYVGAANGRQIFGSFAASIHNAEASIIVSGSGSPVADFPALTGDFTLYADGQSVSGNLVGTISATDTLALGRGRAYVERWEGNIYAAIAVHRVLTEGERANLISWLDGRRGA